MRSARAASLDLDTAAGFLPAAYRSIPWCHTTFTPTILLSKLHALVGEKNEKHDVFIGLRRKNTCGLKYVDLSN